MASGRSSVRPTFRRSAGARLISTARSSCLKIRSLTIGASALRILSAPSRTAASGSPTTRSPPVFASNVGRASSVTIVPSMPSSTRPLQEVPTERLSREDAGEAHASRRRRKPADRGLFLHAALELAGLGVDLHELTGLDVPGDLDLEPGL